MKEELSLLNPYNYSYDSNSETYQFITKNNIAKIDRVLKVENTILYTSLLYHNKNQEKDLLIDAFDKINDALNSDTEK